MSASSRRPAFSAWIPSPRAGPSTTTMRSATAAHRSSACPEPTVSISTRSHPQARRNPAMSSTMRGTLPDEERVAIERTYTRSLMAGLSTEDMRMRSPSRAPPVRGELGSTASSATLWPSLAHAVIKASTRTDLPTPGAPVMAIVFHSFAGVSRGWSMSWLRARVPFSILESKRAMARRSPFKAWSRPSFTFATPLTPKIPSASRCPVPRQHRLSRRPAG